MSGIPSLTTSWPALIRLLQDQLQIEVDGTAFSDAGLLDLGIKAGLPLDYIPVILPTGQSNAKGNDAGGSKIVEDNIWTIDAVIGYGAGGNGFTPPTQLYPAAFGMAPFANGTYGPIDPATAYNNEGLQMANAIRASSSINPNTPILVIPWFYPGNSIRPFITTTTPYARSYFDDLFTMLSFAETAAMEMWGLPIKIIYVPFSQHEADSTSAVLDTVNSSGWVTAYGNTPNPAQTQGVVIPAANSQSGWLSAFNTLVANLRALPYWNPAAVIGVDQPKMWAGNTTNYPNPTTYVGANSARWDAISTLVDGLDPLIGVVSSSQLYGMTQSIVHGVDHYDGNSLVIRGKLHLNHLLQTSSGAKRNNLISNFGTTQGGKTQLAYVSGVLVSINGVLTGNPAQTATGTVSAMLDPEWIFGGAYITLLNTNLLFPPTNIIPGMNGDVTVVCLPNGSAGSSITCNPGLVLEANTLNTTYALTANMLVTVSPINSRWMISGLGSTLTPGFVRQPGISLNTQVTSTSGALKSGNTAVISMAIGGVQVPDATATFDGVINTSSENTYIALAAAMQASLNTIDAAAVVNYIPSRFGFGIITPSGTFSIVARSITGSAPPTWGALIPNAYALTSAQFENNFAWLVPNGYCFVLPGSNASTPGRANFFSTSGTGRVDCWPSDSMYTGTGSLVVGAGGAGGVNITTGTNGTFESLTNARYSVTGGNISTYAALLTPPIQGYSIGGNIGSGQCAVASLSLALVTGNVFTLSFTVNAHAMVVSGTWTTGSPLSVAVTKDGTAIAGSPFVSASNITTSDAALTQFAVAVAAALNNADANWTCSSISLSSMLGLYGIGANALSAASGTVTGGTQQAVVSFTLGAYALTTTQCNNAAYNCLLGITYVLPSANAAAPCNVTLIANGGSGSAGDIFFDCYNGASLWTRQGSLVVGTSGKGTIKNRIKSGTSVTFQPTTSRWNISGGTGMNSISETQVATATTVVPDDIDVAVVNISLATCAITMPNNPREGQVVVVYPVTAVTTLSFTNGTFVNAPTALTINAPYKARYTTSGSKWYFSAGM